MGCFLPKILASRYKNQAEAGPYPPNFLLIPTAGGAWVSRKAHKEKCMQRSPGYYFESFAAILCALGDTWQIRLTQSNLGTIA